MHFNSTIVKYLKNILEWQLYIGFAVGSIFFVEKTMNDFWQRKTYYQVTTLPITDKDLPTFTICFEHEAVALSEEEIEIGIHNGSHFEPFKSGENNLINANKRKIRIHFKPLTVASFLAETNRHCYKISPMENGTVLTNDKMIGYFYVYFTPSQWITPQKMTLYISSEENS